MRCVCENGADTVFLKYDSITTNTGAVKTLENPSIFDIPKLSLISLRCLLCYCN